MTVTKHKVLNTSALPNITANTEHLNPKQELAVAISDGGKPYFNIYYTTRVGGL